MKLKLFQKHDYARLALALARSFLTIPAFVIPEVNDIASVDLLKRGMQIIYGAASVCPGASGPD